VCPQGGRNGTLGDSSAPCQGGDGVEIDNVTEMRATSRWLGPAAVAVGIGLALWAWWLDRPPAPLSVDAPAEQFSAARARMPPQFADRALYWHFPAYLEAGQMIGPWRITPAAAVRQGDFKLIEFFEDGRLELYNLALDIGEERELSAFMPEKARQLHTLMQSWRESVGAYVPSELNPEYDPGRSQR